MSLSRFVKVYNNLPLAERDMPCVVLEGEAITWRLAYQYIKENTELGQRIQAELENLNLI